MPISFIHLSDIHFGQEKGGDVFIHNDVKDQLIRDVEEQVANLPGQRAAGVIVCGDIAFAGKHEQYVEAGQWLDKVANAAGCAKTDVQMVPGNHDVDRAKLTEALTWMLGEIKQHGESRLDQFLAQEGDRTLLYSRFHAYEPFSAAYGCPLDRTGGNAGSRIVTLGPGRTLQFIGLNTALICAKEDAEESLLLGAQQRILPEKNGCELVVMTHHPLNWLQDSEEARKYLRARARVFVSGHEHKPSVKVDKVEAEKHLLMLASGSTVPPTNENEFGYTYNILQFDWDSDNDALVVTVIPRKWDDDNKRFTDDPERLGNDGPTYTLGCPNFRKAAKPASEHPVHPASPDHALAQIPVVQEEGVIEERTNPAEPSKYPMLRLTFFRDLTAAQRASVLTTLDALPPEWQNTLTHNVEQQILESLQKTNRLKDLEEAIREVQSLAAQSDKQQT